MMPERTRLPKPRYTGVPDILFDKLLPEIDDCELRVILVIIRKTLGWRQNEEDLSLNEIAKLAGISKTSVVRSTTSLIDRGLIERFHNLGDSKEGQIESTYRVILYDENSPTPEPPTAQGGEPLVAQAPEPPTAQVIGRVLNTYITDTTSSESHLHRVSFETFLHTWNRHRGFKRPQKPIREKARENWEAIFITQEELDAALDGFYGSVWAKQANYPMLAFLKDPCSWAEGHSPEPFVPPMAPTILPPATDAPQPAVAPGSLPEIAVRWNQEVPAGPKVEVWMPDAKTKELYTAAVEVPLFHERLGDVFARCQDLLTRFPEKAKFINFKYVLKSWAGILNGDCKWLENKMDVRPPSKLDQQRSAGEEAVAQIKREIAERKKRENAAL